MAKIGKWVADAVRRLRSLHRHFTLYSDANQALQIHREYAAALFRVTFFFAFLGTGSCLLFTFAFRRILSLPIILSDSCVLLTYAVLIGRALMWRSSQKHRQFLVTSTWLYVGLGLAWGILVNLFAADPLPDERSNVTGLVMALVSTPMLAFPISVALAFFIPVSALSSFAILYTLDSVSTPLAISFVSFLGFALTALVYSNKSFLDRSLGGLKLQREHETIRLFLREYEEASTDWLWETDAEGRFQNVSLQMASTFGMSLNNLKGTDFAIRIGGDLPDKNEARELQRLLKDRVAFRDLTMSISTATGLRIVNMTGHPTYHDSGKFCGWRGIGSDITEARIAQQQVEFHAHHDSLTGLFNSRSFFDKLDSFCRTEAHAEFAVLCIDLDDFKSVNDDKGHQAGDRLLQTVGARISDVIRPGDVGARLGGDEFGILLPGVNRSDAMAQAQRIISVIQMAVLTDEHSLVVGASAGIALYPQHGAASETLIRRADLALYHAKERGKGSVTVFKDEMEVAYTDRMRLASELGIALDEGQIYLDYQPIFETQSGNLVAVEALARWLHPTRGVLTAGAFIPTAESGELIERLGEYVLRLACSTAMGWRLPLRVSVNLSLKQLKTDALIEVIRNCLQESGLPSERLALEVTESVFLHSTGAVVNRLRAIRKLGARVVLDDFGTGYSSLSYLNDFDIDGVKIDFSFTRRLMTSPKTRAIVFAVSKLAQDLEIDLVAEGVETLTQLNWFRDHGIPHVQGYLLGRPTTPEVIGELCRTLNIRVVR